MAESSRFFGDADEFGALVLRYLDNVATPEECELLRDELIASPERRRIVVSLCQRHGQLAELLKTQQQQAELATHTRPTFRVSRQALVATAAALFIALGVWKFFQIAHTFGVPIARFEQVQGEVYFVDFLGQRIAASDGWQIRSGQGLQTVGDDSSVVIKYDDGTQLDIGAGSVIARLVGGPGLSKQVVLTEGYFTADVAKQPRNRPMLVSTPQAEVRVVGTRFNLSGGDDITFVETREGEVKVTRKSDGNSIDLAAGDEAAIGRQRELVKSRSLQTTDSGLVQRFEGKWTAALCNLTVRLATSNYLGGQVDLYDVTTQELVRTFSPHRSRITALAFTSSGNSIAAGCADENIRYLSCNSQQETITEIKHGSISDLAFPFMDTGLTVLSTPEGSDERVVSVLQGNKHDTWKVVAQRWAFSPRGYLLATARQGSRKVTIWRVNGEVRSVIENVGKNVFSLAFSRDDRILAINDSSGTITLRNIDTGEIEHTLTCAGGRVFGMTFSPKGELLATGHQDGAVRLWNVPELDNPAVSQPIVTLVSESSHISAVAFTNDGKKLLTRAIRLATPDRKRDGIVELWDVEAAIKSSKSQSTPESP